MTLFQSAFLADYLSYARRLTDAPEEFHALSALSALGACASRVRVRFGAVSTAPVIWTVLVAPSAFYRKTTCIELARRLAAAARPELRTRPVYGATAVVSSLRGSSERLLCVDDFTGLLLATARERLVRLSDSGAPVSLLAGASLSALSARMSVADIASGFLARFAVVVADQKTEWRALPGAIDPVAEAPLSECLRRAAAVEGEASFDACRTAISDWGREAAEWISDMPAKSVHWETAAGLLSRLELTLLKIAALIEISTTGSLAVSLESFESARRLEKLVRNGFGRLLTKELKRGGEFHDALRVVAMVRRSPGITRRRLMQNSHIAGDALNSLLAKLCLAGRLRKDANRLFPGLNGTAESAAMPHVAEPGANGHRIELVEVGT